MQGLRQLAMSALHTVLQRRNATKGVRCFACPARADQETTTNKETPC